MIKNFSDSNKLAKYLANEILELLQKKNKCVLGCPGGRSLTKTYYQLGRISHKKKISLENLTIVMMDEYVLKRKNSFSLVDPKSHFSCVRFSNQVIKRLLNYKKRKNHKITNERILFPNVLDPAKYDHQIKNIGGIDIFLLASGEKSSAQGGPAETHSRLPPRNSTTSTQVHHGQGLADGPHSMEEGGEAGRGPGSSIPSVVLGGHDGGGGSGLGAPGLWSGNFDDSSLALWGGGVQGRGRGKSLVNRNIYYYFTHNIWRS